METTEGNRMPAAIGEQLFFSSSNEDGNSEIAALIPTGKRVLCVAGSGSRAFDLLLADPREVVAIDVSPAQSSLAELQARAIQSLAHDQFLAFIGINPDGNRLDTFKSLRSSLTLETAAFWDRNQSIIKGGVIYAGKWERIFGLLGWVLGLAGGHWRDSLFQARDIDEQYAVWRKRDNQITEALYRFGSSRWIWQYLVKDPGIQLVSNNVDIARHFLGRTRFAARRHMFRECPFAWLMFYGRFPSTAALPLYLRAENYERIRSRIHTLTLTRASLKTFLNSADSGRFDAFSLSDFSSYTGEAEYRETWEWIVKKSNPGARFCERNFLVRYPVPSLNIQQDPRLADQLAAQDKTFYYNLSCGTVDA